MEENNNNKYLFGIIGALIGAFVGAIPWILIYVFANYIVAILATLIAIGSYQGYKLSKAKIDKKLPVIISITSIIAITIATFLISPLIELAKEGYSASFENLQVLYENSEYTSAVVGNYVLSIIFTILGISGVVSNLHKQIKAGVNREDIKINISNSPEPVAPEEMDAIKNIFVKNDALNKYNGLNKEEILQDLYTQIETNRANEIFNLLKAQNIIRKSKGKYYFSEKAQNSNLNRVGKALAVSFAIILIMVIVIIVAVLASDSKRETKNNSVNKTNYVANINTDALNESLNSIKNLNESLNKINNTTNNTNNNATTNNSTLNNIEIKEKILTSTNMKFVPKDNLLILTEKEIKTYLGNDYTNYEIVAMDLEGTKMLYSFIIDATKEDVKDYTAEEFLKQSLNGAEYNKIENKKISDFDFAKAVSSFEQNGVKYTEECYVCKLDNKFICFDYSYKNGSESNFEQMIQKK